MGVAASTGRHIPFLDLGVIYPEAWEFCLNLKNTQKSADVILRSILLM